MATLAQPLPRDKPADWHLPGLLAIAFGHGVNDWFSGTVALTIFFVISGAHLSPWYQGAIGFIWYLMSSVVQPLFGAYTDKHGRWWFMPTAVLAVVLALSFATLSPTLWVLALLIVVGGIGSAVMHPEAGKYAALLSGTRRSQAISIFQMGGSIGFALGPVTIAFLLAHFDRYGSLVMLVPGLIGVAVVFVAIKHADALAASARRERAHRQGTAAHVDRFGIALVVASTTLRFLTTISFVTFLPNLLTGRGDSLVVAGQVVTLFLLLANVGMWLGGYLGDRLGPVIASATSLVLAVPCLLGLLRPAAGGGDPGLDARQRAARRAERTGRRHRAVDAAQESRHGTRAHQRRRVRRGLAAGHRRRDLRRPRRRRSDAARRLLRPAARRGGVRDHRPPLAGCGIAYSRAMSSPALMRRSKTLYLNATSSTGCMYPGSTVVP